MWILIASIVRLKESRQARALMYKAIIEETDNEVALVIAAFKSNPPVIEIAFIALVAPTVSEEESPKTTLPVPTLAVKSLAVELLLFTVPLKVKLLFVVVKEVSADKDTGPE